MPGGFSEDANFEALQEAVVAADQPFSVGAGAAAKKPARSMIIDVVRGFAITLVVLGHTNQGIIHRGWWGSSRLGNRLDAMIYAFHMPAFFFVSGIFLCASVGKRGMAHYTVEKLRTMIYPYLLWMFIFFEARVLFHSFTVQPVLGWREFFVTLLSAKYSWFLPTIFLAVMLGMLLRRVPMALLFVLACAAALTWPGVHIEDVDGAVRHLPFLVAGMWVGFNFSRMEALPRGVSALLGVAAAVPIVLATVYGAGHPKLLFVPLGLLGTLMLMFFAQTMGRGYAARALAWAGEASFGIFLLSSFPQGGGRELVLRLLHTTAPLPQLIVPTVLAVFLPGWLYQHRARLRIGWLFVAPFGAKAFSGRLGRLRSGQGPRQGLRG